MKNIKPSNNPQRWPRMPVKSIKARKRDLIVCIADWTKDKDEPAWDVEVYIGGIYDWHESETFCLDGNPQKAKADAVAYASAQIAKLL